MGWVGMKESSLQSLEGDDFSQGAQFKGTGGEFHVLRDVQEEQ